MQPRRTMPKKFSTWYSQRAAPPFAPFEGWAPPQIESFDVRLGRHAVHTPSRNPICTTISLTSLPHLRDNHYIAQAQCSHLHSSSAMFPSFHNSFVSKILPVTLFNPRFSKGKYPLISSTVTAMMWHGSSSRWRLRPDRQG